jgi:hypothetical protein
MGFSGIVVLAAPKLYHEKPLSINLFGEGIDLMIDFILDGNMKTLGCLEIRFFTNSSPEIIRKSSELSYSIASSFLIRRLEELQRRYSKI